ncbi:Ppx/GppA phosphatase family protein [Caldanaerobius polysaccharolyticus]|uniref:Ppx/GppA phosphatase family protein n=1 Tax=Caldanaerobius polysaccharolyticus TaxID=44256 RepID=UPI00047E6BC0|nr:Ppx/GppA phosphatase family protein [Caldanaerobius polysaccharolyticus]
MRFGCIDIGTNSVRLLIADNGKNGLIRIYKGINTTRLGTGVDHTGTLNIDAIRRTVDAVVDFKKIAMSYGCDKIIAIATSAVRDAANRDVLFQEMWDKAGIEVEVISGEREAELAYKGVQAGVKVEKAGVSLLIVDIGGGSTEFTWGKSGQIKYRHSVNIGAVRLTERYGVVSAAKREDVKDLFQDIESNLCPLSSSLKELIDVKGVMAVGVGGTVTSLAAVDQKLEVYDPQKIHGYTLTYDKVCSILDLLLKMKEEERRHIKGLYAKRADIIVAGTAILFKVMELLGLSQLIVSEWDNLEGLIVENMS